MKKTKPAEVDHKKTVARTKTIGIGNHKIRNFIDTMGEKDVSTANTELAKFFFGCNIPFAVVESDAFKNFIKFIRPAYVESLPSRKLLSTTLLDEVYDASIDNIRLSLETTESVLLMDGWKNTSNNTKNVTAMLHNTIGSRRSFLDSYDFTSDSETGEALEAVLDEACEKAMELFKTEVYAVVTDRAAPMLKMGRTTLLWHVTCNSHLGELFAKDIFKITDCSKSLNVVIKEFKHPNFERAIMDRGGTKLKSLCETRWCFFRDSCQSVVKNFSILKQIAADPSHGKMKQEVVKLLFDENFENDITNSVKIFNPICTLINMCQKSTSTQADALNCWINIKNEEVFKTDQFQSILERCFKIACNIYALSAYYLNPCYEKNNLTEDQQDSVISFLVENLSIDGVAQLSDYNEKQGLFKTLFEKNLNDGKVFWQIASTKYKELSGFAIKLLNIPASTAQIERLFSNWSFIHNKLRNRLTFDKSKKLLHIYYDSKLKESQNSDEY